MMRVRFSALALAIVFAASAAATWAQPLPTDDHIQQGTLDNGVKWMFRQHANPPGRIGLLVHVNAGSLNETEPQRGLAHFIEHMVFNGTEHFAPGELIKYYESIGMEFGADLNAFTSFDQTVYMLFTPDTDPEHVGKALMTLSDYVFRASFIPEELEKERGVIMEEWRSGKNAQQRIRDEYYKQVFDGTRLAERIPIGLPEVIQHAARSEFLEFYRTWYRPENVTLIMVGDTDVEPLMPFVKKWFGEYKAEKPAGKEHGPEFKSFKTQRAVVLTDPELGSCDVEMTNVSPSRPPVTTVEDARRELLEGVGAWIVNRRLEERVQKGEASYQDAGTFIGDFLRGAAIASAEAEGEAKDWNKMLEELIVEVSRAREHGFTEHELDLARKELIASAEHAVEAEPTRNARGFLFGMMSSVNDGEPIMSAAQELELTKKLLETIKLDEVNKAFVQHFGADTFTFVVTMPETDGVAVPSQDDVLAAARAALARKTEAPAEVSGPSDLLAALPEAGSVVESEFDDDLAITSAWLANGVRVHHRQMDYKKDQVLVSINLAGGRIEETAANLGLTDFVAWSLGNQPATGRLTSTNIRDAMTGKTVEVGADAGSDNLMLSISGSPKDIEQGFQLAYALLTDGVLEETGLKVWQQRMTQYLTMLKSMPEYHAFHELMQVVAGGDPRLQPLLPLERVEATTVQDAQPWFNRLRQNAPIEVAVVGDIDKDRAMQLVTQYLGALPKRPRTAAHLASLRDLKRGEGPFNQDLEVATMTPKAMTIMGFLGCQATDDFDRRALELASQTLSSRLIKHIREDLALVYSLSASNMPAEAFNDAGLFLTRAQCDPAKAKTVAEETHKIFAEFADKGPSAEELANAKKQIAVNLDDSTKEPRYWRRVLATLDYHNGSLAEEKAEQSAYEKYTAEQVTDVFRKYYKPDRRLTIIAVPKAAAETEETPQAVESPTS